MIEKQDFVSIAVQDIRGLPVTEESHEIPKDTPAISEFVNTAVKDLKGGEDKTVPEGKLADAFNRVIVETHTRPSSTEVIDQFKEVAESEAKDTLTKLLKGIK